MYTRKHFHITSGLFLFIAIILSIVTGILAFLLRMDFLKIYESLDIQAELPVMTKAILSSHYFLAVLILLLIAKERVFKSKSICLLVNILVSVILVFIGIGISILGLFLPLLPTVNQ